MNTKFDLKDFMTAAQATKILEYIESLESRITDLEHKVANLEGDTSALQRAQAINEWKDIQLQTDIHQIYNS